MERFRRTEGIDPSAWAETAHINRRQLARYRSGREQPYSHNLAALVRAARKITGRPVAAHELVDLGEDEPLNTVSPTPFLHSTRARKQFHTRLDQCLLREGVLPALLAREASVSRQNLLRKRCSTEAGMSVGFLHALVCAMRRLGRDIRASDLIDLGEDP